jgi:hypothetical protein
MNFDMLATGATVQALGLMPDEGRLLAAILVVLCVIIGLFLTKSVRDRKVLEQEPVVGATIVLTIIAILCFVAGILILLH